MSPLSNKCQEWKSDLGNRLARFQAEVFVQVLVGFLRRQHYLKPGSPIETLVFKEN